MAKGDVGEKISRLCSLAFASLEMTKNINEGAPLGGIGVTDYAGEMTGCEDRLVADVRIGYVESNGIRACLLMRPPHSLKRCG